MESFFTSHPGVAPTIIYGLFASVSWFMIRAIRKIDANQEKLFKTYGDLDRRLSKLQGAHDAYTGIGGHRSGR